MADILIIDDERDICELLSMALTNTKNQCKSVYTVKSAIKILKQHNFDVIFSDVRLPDGDGLDLLAHINKHYPQTPVCVMTAHGNMDMAIKALRLGAFDFINKPFELKQVRNIVQSVVKKSQNQPQKNEESNEFAKKILIGESRVMQNVKQLIDKVAKSQAPVLIHGESGTGKEVAAKLIHQLSRRSEGKFIAVNCGAIPENLLESEFFGYKKGSFTGAMQDSDGLFKSANGGTLFLDEIADLPLSMQVKLLRVIQERAVRPIGSDKEEAIDVRIISASHCDLANQVRSGLFREDLFYRLNVVGLSIPPLRDRLEDLPLLSDFILQKLHKESGYNLVKLSDEALNKLKECPFRGNVRELNNILERALTFLEGDIIRENDIQFIGGLNAD